MAIHLGLAQREQAKMPIFQLFFPGRSLTTYFLSCCMRVWLLISLHLVANCDPPVWNIGGSVFKHFQLLEATKNKYGGLDNHKVIKNNWCLAQADCQDSSTQHQSVKTGCFIKCAETHTESKKVKKQENMFQEKE